MAFGDKPTWDESPDTELKKPEMRYDPALDQPTMQQNMMSQPNAPKSEYAELLELLSKGSAANPYVAGAGLALQTASMIQQSKQNQQNARYTAELNKAKANQDALDKLSNIGQNLRV